MRLPLLIILILFHFSTARAGFEKACRELFMVGGEAEVHKINYKTKPMANVDGRPTTREMTAGPVSLDATLLTEFILTTDLTKTNAYNQHTLHRQRHMNPVPGGQIGLGIHEQWLFYSKNQTHKIISDLLTFHAEKFNQQQLEILNGILQLDLSKINLVMVDDPSQFEVAGGPHRIARTEGKPGSPIYVNAKLLQEFEIHKPKDKEDGYVRMNSTRPFDSYSPVKMIAKWGSPEETIKKLNLQADVNRLSSVFSILLHELGHYLQIKDDAEKTLDQMATAAAEVFRNNINEVTLADKNHPWLKFVFHSLDPQKRNGQLLLFDSMNFYDITASVIKGVQKQTKLGFTEHSIANLRWEDGHTAETYSFTAPDVLNFDFIAHTANGSLKVPVRIANYFAASTTSEFFVTPAAPWRTRPVQLKIDSTHLAVEMQILTDQISPVDRFNVPLTTDWVANQSKQLALASTWKNTIQLPLNNYDMPVSAKVYFSSPDMMNPGFVKRAKIPFDVSRIEPLGAQKVLIHSEFKIPENFKGGDYTVERIDLLYKDGRIVKYEPNIKESIKILGPQSKASLAYFGAHHFLAESPKLAGPRPSALFNLDQIKNLPIGATIPLVYEVENLAQINEISLHGHVHFKAAGFAKINGLHINVVGPNKSPFVAKVEVSGKGNKQHVIVHLNVPKFINGQAVESLFINSIYIRDNNLNEIFDPAPVGFGVDIR